MSFIARPEGMNLLAHLLGSSDYLWDDFLGIHFRDLLPLLERLAQPQVEVVSERSSKDALRATLRSVLRGASTLAEKKVRLNRFKDDQLFFIDVQHLLNPAATLMTFSHSLTDLAEIVIDEAVRTCAENMPGRLPGRFTVCGLGKFGGREMGYASDLELMFVHEEPEHTLSLVFEQLARQTIELIEARHKGVFEIDLRLRPLWRRWSLVYTF
jgi:glutamate-ammonia-ligase adenylyltransferase